MSVQVISAEMLASNDFKINGTGEAPTIYSGSMGTYDSATDSYYFSSNCGMDWKNWSNIGMTLEKAQKLTKIEFEYEGMVSNNALGRNFDMQMQTYFNTNLLFINGIADGYDDSSSDKQKFARIKNSGSDQWETTEEVPFNSSSYQNAFHKVKWVWEIENSVAKELTIYVNGNLFCHYSGTLYSFSITALGTNILRFAAIDHTNVKYVKVAFYHNPVTPSGGAGSGYIGNNLVSNKKMVGYNVPTSSAESTKTESVEDASESPVSGKPKIGNGFARIKLIRALPDELVLYDNGQVNTDYFDTDAEIGETEAQPISKNYEVKSNHLLLEYNNWRDTTQWRGILLLFNKKTFPSVYTKVKIDLEMYAKYNSGWAAIEFNVNDNQTGVKNFNGGVGVIQRTGTRYQISGQNSFEATSRYVTDEMEILDGNNYLTFEFSGVNQYHEGYAKIYKITLTM